MNKEIIKALGGSKNFDIDANNDYVAEMLEGQLDSFIKNEKVKLSDDDFEKWVKEIQVLCAECYKCGWERALKDADYRKTIWHKVADGDMPKDYEHQILTVNDSNYYEVANFDKNGDFWVYDDYCHKYVLSGIIAWTELSAYKE